jgi:hypothetical protein
VSESEISYACEAAGSSWVGRFLSSLAEGRSATSGFTEVALKSALCELAQSIDRTINGTMDSHLHAVSGARNSPAPFLLQRLPFSSACHSPAFTLSIKPEDRGVCVDRAPGKLDAQLSLANPS